MAGEWRTASLAECASFQEGYVNPPQANPAFFGDEVKWLRANDLNDGYVFETTRRLSTEGFESAGKSALLFEPDTLAISKSGTIGRVGILKDWMCGNRAVINIKVNKAHCNPRFIFYVLLQNRPTVENLAIGSVQKNLYTSALGKLEFQLPPKTIQDEVAHILGTLDDKIELNRRMNETLEDIARAMFKSWFVDFDPVRAKMNGEPPESICHRLGLTPDLLALFPDHLVDSEFGEIPEGWKVGTIDDHCHLNAKSWTAKTIPDEVHYVDLANTKEGIISEAQVFMSSEAPSRARRILRAGDTIVGTVRPGNRSFALIGDGGPALTGSTGFAVLTPKRQELRELVYFLATDEDNIDRLSRLADGAAYPAVRPEVVTAGASIIPRAEVIDAFHKLVAPIIDFVIANRTNSDVLSGIRDELLPRLFSGELRVTDAASIVEEVTA